MHIDAVTFEAFSTGDCPVKGKAPHGYTFMYVLDGSGKIIDGGRCIHACPGDLVIVPSQHDHILRTRSSMLRCYRTVLYPCGMANGEIEELIEARMPKIAIGLNRRWFFEAVRSRLASDHAFAKKAAFHSIVSLIYEINTPHPEHATGSAAVETALREIQRNMSEASLNVGRLALAVGLDRSYFIRLFRSRVGLPPNQYFLRLKVEAAQPLLRRTELSVKNIADDFGFADQFHFSRVFKRITGVSPLAYRMGAEEENVS